MSVGNFGGYFTTGFIPLLQSPKLRMYFLNYLSEFIYLDFLICFVHFVGLAHLSLLCPILNSVRV